VKRPTGITVLAVLYFILAVLSLLWSGLVLGVGGLSSVLGGLFSAEGVEAFGMSTTWAGTVGITAAIVQLVVALGLLTMKKWAWALALVGVALTVVEGIAGILSGGPLAITCGLLGLAIPLGILLYLLRPGVKQAFVLRQEMGDER
jgi:hypothetical protein